MKLKLLNETHWFYRCSKIKKITALLTLIMAFSANVGLSQTTLQTVDFEIDGAGYTATPSNYYEGNGGASIGDYWVRTKWDAGSSSWRTEDNIEVNLGLEMSGWQGTWFWAAEDVDNISSVYVTTDAVTVTGYTNLQVKFLAATRGLNGIETTDFLKVEYSIDGGAYSILVQFIGDGELAGNSWYHEDVGGDGTIDAGGATLSQIFTEYTYDVPTTGTTLQLRFSAYNGSGEDLAFDNISVLGTAAATAPTATTNGASSISTTSATLNGNVNANDVSTSVTFEYGLTTSYGMSVTADQSPVTGSTNTLVSKAISSLSPNTTYHYRVKAVNTEGTTYGANESFTTLKLSQTITFGALPNKTYGDIDYAPGATTSSGLTVTYSSSNTSVASIVSGKIHIVGAGTCTIYADQAGNSTYDAASQKSQSLTINKATPTVTIWPSATGITHGEDLSSATLSGGSASVAGSFAYDDNTITPNAGTYSAALIFTPTDGTNYSTVAGNIDVDVSKATPTVTIWPSAAGITYGQDLSVATLSGGTASVAGSFAYDDNTISPNAGTYSAALTFTPTDATNYNTVAGNIDVAVSKATPTVTIWPSATGITHGEDLSSATLSGGSASVAGSFAYDDNTITPNAGTYSAALIFTPTDGTNYNTVAGNIDVDVSKAIPTVTIWPSAAGITYGQDLSSATLSGGTASVAGSFAYDDNTISPNAGTYSAALTFTPTDATNYNTVTGNIDVAVSKATPTVTIWPSAAGITYGQDLSLATLSGGTASVAGSFAYDDNTITPDAGSYSAALTFTPTDATNYNTVTGNIDVAVSKATPTVTIWPSAAGITYGQDLSVATLSGGSASVAGSFAYDDNTITPDAGTYSAALTFTPTDATNYNTVTGNIDVAVSKATPTVTIWPSAAGITYGQDLSLATLSGGTASVAGSFAYDDNTITPDAGSYSAALTFTPTDATNYNTVTGNIDVAVSKATPTVTIWPSAAGITYGQDLSLATLSGGSASVAGSFAYDDNTITPDAGTYSAALTFTPTDATNYNTVTGNIDVAVSKTILSATAENKSKTYGEANPTFTVAFFGFVGADDETDLDTPPTAACTATESSNVGDYPITVSEGTDNNYTFSYFNGTLTIDAATSIVSNINTIKAAWPNPTSGIINVDKIFCSKVYKVYNVAGSIVSNGKVINTTNGGIIDISHLDNGIYVIKINNTTYRIIKE